MNRIKIPEKALEYIEAKLSSEENIYYNELFEQFHQTIEEEKN